VIAQGPFGQSAIKGRFFFLAAAVPTRRARLSLSASIAIHGFLILGIGFVAAAPALLPLDPPVLELILAPLPQESTEDALALAQHNLAGGGTITHLARTIAEPPVTLTKPPAKHDETASVNHLIALMQQTAPYLPSNTAQRVEAAQQTRALVTRYRGEIESLEDASTRLARQSFVSASTRQSEYAAYMVRWREQVEDVGNHHAPEWLGRSDHTGEVLLAVAIKPDGALHSVRVLNSSGNPTIDAMAMRIARLAAPFEVLPEEIRRHTDVLHITRTWQFLPGGQTLAR
jgi:protein TonB